MPLDCDFGKRGCLEDMSARCGLNQTKQYKQRTISLISPHSRTNIERLHQAAMYVCLLRGGRSGFCLSKHSLCSRRKELSTVM